MRPGRGGHAWVFLNWLLGLRSLGFDVTFVDRMAEPETRHIEWLGDVMRTADADQRWGLTARTRTYGSSRAEMESWFSECDVCIDVMGHADPSLARLAPTSVFVDIDPGFGQLWQHLGQAKMFGRHTAYATVGLGLASGASRIPACGLDWIPTLPPVDLSEWPAATSSSGCFTSVATWRGPFDPITVDDDVLGLRVHQFRRFLDVPANVTVPIELALDIDPADAGDRDALLRAGYGLVCPRRVTDTTGAFRAYVQHSAGEFCVAKDLYVRTTTGWFSDRSACYLASGRPVVHHDTGLSGRFELDGGLLLFEDPQSAATAINAVVAEPEHHRTAARDFAARYLDARTVVADLLNRAGVS